MIRYIRAAPTFALRPMASALVVWAFLRGIAASLVVDSGESAVWVLVVGFILVAVDSHRLRPGVFLINLGVSRTGMWLPGWCVLVGLEVLFHLMRSAG